jgi:hypothetical protein
MARTGAPRPGWGRRGRLGTGLQTPTHLAYQRFYGERLADHGAGGSEAQVDQMSGGMSRHQDDRQGGMRGGKGSEQADAVESGHDDVRDDQAEPPVQCANQFECLYAIFGGVDLVPFPFQGTGGEATHGGLIVDDEEVRGAALALRRGLLWRLHWSGRGVTIGPNVTKAGWLRSDAAWAGRIFGEAHGNGTPACAGHPVGYHPCVPRVGYDIQATRG